MLPFYTKGENKFAGKIDSQYSFIYETSSDIPSCQLSIEISTFCQRLSTIEYRKEEVRNPTFVIANDPYSIRISNHHKRAPFPLFLLFVRFLRGLFQLFLASLLDPVDRFGSFDHVPSVLQFLEVLKNLLASDIKILLSFPGVQTGRQHFV